MSSSSSLLSVPDWVQTALKTKPFFFSDTTPFCSFPSIHIPLPSLHDHCLRIHYLLEKLEAFDRKDLYQSKEACAWMHQNIFYLTRCLSPHEWFCEKRHAFDLFTILLALWILKAHAPTPQTQETIQALWEAINLLFGLDSEGVYTKLLGGREKIAYPVQVAHFCLERTPPPSSVDGLLERKVQQFLDEESVSPRHESVINLFDSIVPLKKEYVPSLSENSLQTLVWAFTSLYIQTKSVHHQRSLSCLLRLYQASVLLIRAFPKLFYLPFLDYDPLALMVVFHQWVREPTNTKCLAHPRVQTLLSHWSLLLELKEETEELHKSIELKTSFSTFYRQPTTFAHVNSFAEFSSRVVRKKETVESLRQQKEAYPLDLMNVLFSCESTEAKNSLAFHPQSNLTFYCILKQEVAKGSSFKVTRSVPNLELPKCVLCEVDINHQYSSVPYKLNHAHFSVCQDKYRYCLDCIRKTKMKANSSNHAQCSKVPIKNEFDMELPSHVFSCPMCRQDVINPMALYEEQKAMTCILDLNFKFSCLFCHQQDIAWSERLTHLKECTQVWFCTCHQYIPRALASTHICYQCPLKECQTKHSLKSFEVLKFHVCQEHLLCSQTQKA